MTKILEQPMYESSKVNSKGIFIFLLFFLLFLLFSYALVGFLVVTYKDQIKQETINNNKLNISSDINILKKYEQIQLNSRGKINEKNGVQRIPIDEAIIELVKKYK